MITDLLYEVARLLQLTWQFLNQMALLRQQVSPLAFPVLVSRFYTAFSFLSFGERHLPLSILFLTFTSRVERKEGRKIHCEPVTYTIVKWRFTHNASERIVVFHSSFYFVLPLASEVFRLISGLREGIDGSYR